MWEQDTDNDGPVLSLAGIGAGTRTTTETDRLANQIIGSPGESISSQALVLI